jgi:probable addiction module antidote protein
MTFKINHFGPAEYLETDTDIAEYLSETFTFGDAVLRATLLSDIARLRGMAKIARASGVTREALHNALQLDAQPRFKTIARVYTALGLKLQVAVAM